MSAVSGARFSVAATAVAIATAGSSALRVKVTNTGTTAIDLGGATVTSGGGHALASNASLDFALMPGQVLYAIGVVTAVSVHVLAA